MHTAAAAPPAPDLLPRARRVVQFCGAAVLALGCLALAGRVFDADALRRLVPGLVSMKANAAGCFCLCGLALWLRADDRGGWRRRAARAAAAVVAAVGALTVAQYAAGVDLGIDNLLLADGAAGHRAAVAGAPPGRMAPAGAAMFVMAGVALWLLDAGRRLAWVGQVLTLAALSLAMVGLVGYAYGVRGLHRFTGFNAASLHAAATFAVLCAGLLAARPQRGPAGVLAAVLTGGAGGALARRLLPCVVLAPVALGGLAVAGVRTHPYGAEKAAAVIAVLTVLALAAVVVFAARHLNRVSRSALTDALTGVGNRALFDHRLPAELSLARRWGRPLSCLMVDADHFKQLNDAHGHAFGDEVLRVIGRLLLAGSRREDTVCRYGGEEFVILLPNTPPGGAVVLAERLREAVAAHPFTHRGRRVEVTCSIGVSAVDSSATTDGGGAGVDDTLVARADAALYDAKRAGRNRVALRPPARVPETPGDDDGQAAQALSLKRAG